MLGAGGDATCWGAAPGTPAGRSRHPAAGGVRAAGVLSSGLHYGERTRVALSSAWPMGGCGPAACGGFPEPPEQGGGSRREPAAAPPSARAAGPPCGKMPPPLCHATAPAPSLRHPGHPGQSPHLMVTEMLRASRGALASPPLPIAPPSIWPQLEGLWDHSLAELLAPSSRPQPDLSTDRGLTILSLTAVVLHPPPGCNSETSQTQWVLSRRKRDLCLAKGFFFFSCIIIFLLLTVYPPSPDHPQG